MTPKDVAEATVLSLIAQIEHLTAEREKDREALRFYADPQRWIDYSDDERWAVFDRNTGSDLGDDEGGRARARLEDTHE